MPPRTATSPLCSTWCSRRYPTAIRRASSWSTESSWPGRTVVGPASWALGPSLCRRARIGATITRGAGNEGSSSPWVRLHSRARRRPIVSTSGLTRSKGKVSHAGRTATGPSTAPTTTAPSSALRGSRQARSSATRSASTPVEVTTTIGDRSVKLARAAMRTDWAGVATASVASADPRRVGSTGSLRSSREMASSAPSCGPVNGGRDPSEGSGGRERWSRDPHYRRARRPHQGSEWHHCMAESTPSRAMCSTVSAARSTAPSS